MKVWTFYSFKGGVGRSLAVAHVALALANQGKHVVCMDFDLEAPGLDRYLPPTEKRPGTLDIFDAWQSAEQDPNLDDFAAPVKLAALRRGSIRLVGSGHHAPDYSSRLSGLQWEHMPDMGQFLTWLRQRLTGWDGVDHVLLDSRTGMTDLASLCTFHLPDCLIIIFALNHQGLEGSRLVAEAVQRRRSVEEGPRRVLFLPARVDTTDGEKQQEWLDRARNQLAGLGEFPNGLLIPYDRTYAYGELLVAPEDAADWPIVQSYRR
ncbi:MAG TPA: P-loop NTPase, partial [Myxococcota bacterium]|nr:P-loop NTPase [Myxococcota bacterium]